GEWLNQKLSERFSKTRELLDNLMQLMETEEEVKKEGEEPPEDFMIVDEKGAIQTLEVDDLKSRAASTVANNLHEANLTMKQLFFLGMDDESILIDKGL